MIKEQVYRKACPLNGSNSTENTEVRGKRTEGDQQGKKAVKMSSAILMVMGHCPEGQFFPTELSSLQASTFNIRIWVLLEKTEQVETVMQVNKVQVAPISKNTTKIQTFTIPVYHTHLHRHFLIYSTSFLSQVKNRGSSALTTIPHTCLASCKYCWYQRPSELVFGQDSQEEGTRQFLQVKSAHQFCI